MKFGIVPINVGPYAEPQAMLAMARHAEALGFESAWTFEHVIIPYAFESRYPYNKSGKPPGASPDTKFIDPLIAIAHMAAATTRLRFGTGVNILAQANPLFLAKQATSIDYLSGGRLMLGLGAGWLREEFDALGVPFARRGKRTDDYLAALRKAWAEGETVHQSEFIDWHGFHLSPRPVQQPGIPLIVGGITPAAIRRAVRYGDGWFLAHRDMAHLEELLAQLRAECKTQGRDPAALELTAFYSHERDGIDGIARFKALGVERLLVNIVAIRDPDVHGALARIAKDIMPHA